jgi:hypothetical protein
LCSGLSDKPDHSYHQNLHISIWTKLFWQNCTYWISGFNVQNYQWVFTVSTTWTYHGDDWTKSSPCSELFSREKDYVE